MKIATKYYYYFGTAVFLLLILCLAFSKKETSAENEVSFFASEIVEEYRLASDYSGLKKQYKNFVAGDKDGNALRFGSKSFYISVVDVSVFDCQGMLEEMTTKNLRLLSLSVNDNEFYWGRGLPIVKEDINKICKDTNKIIWNFM